jgi:hypothetical protein
VLYVAFVVAAVVLWNHVVEPRLGEPAAFFVALVFGLVSFTAAGLRRQRDRRLAREPGEPHP